MTKLVLIAVAATILVAASARAQDAAKPASGSPRILIAFFSQTGNTRTMAEQIHSITGGDMFHVTTRTPYPDDYNQTTRVARSELDANARPALAATVPVEAMRNYDVIFIGYPNWWSTIPMAMFTFLEQYDLSGKTIIPFCTHGGSGLGRGPADITKLAPGSVVLQGLAVRSNSADRARTEIADWLLRLGFAR